jgi:predicted MFS family arabinose efflux permease
LVPPRSLTEGLAWLSAGLSLGYGAGASLVGRIADAAGARAAFGVTIGAGVVMAVSAVVLRARLRSDASEPVGVG